MKVGSVGSMEHPSITLGGGLLSLTTTATERLMLR